MLREESQVDADKHYSKVDFSPRAVKRVARKQREPVNEPGHDGEDRSHGQDIVEVSNYVVGVVKNDI